MIKIYNSLTNKIEEFKPIKENEVMMYVCGPTVYNSMHIGNSRPVVFFDTVARFFRYLGYRVTFVSNFTDIDDKIINRAKEEGVTEEEISKKYIKEISENYKDLNCLPHTMNPMVTENMNNIINFIDLLVKKDGAYVADGDVYFNVGKIDNYGILSGQSVDNLISGARIEQNEKKQNPVDFTVWKKTDDGVKWSSPWSDGRPGWHTECVVMIHNIFHGKIDIHGGGSDLKFPHHDNEIAQSMCAYGHEIANFWMHNGRIDLSGEKMSKSLGNVIWAKDLLKKAGHHVYRLLMLNVPYRQPLSYKEDILVQASNDFEKIKRAYISLFRKLELDYNSTNRCDIKDGNLLAIKEEFINALEDDFNTANAISTIFKIVKVINNLVRTKDAEENIMAQAKSLLYEMLWVLGIEIEVKPLTEDEKVLVIEWNQARSQKYFDKADKIREKINQLGIIL